VALPLTGRVLGVGVDAVDVARLRRTLERTPTFASRTFTDGERALAGSRKDPVPALAARFAAKEAVMKALGVGLGAFALKDVEVVRLESGQPVLALHGAAAALAAERGVAEWHLSLTHTALVAVAMVVAAAGPGSHEGAPVPFAG
jgi:holo-[acyl-carrier protein] synthase